ncbi:MAG TPA: hypothetical protein PKH58_13360 [Paludibacteraceae bacterium]|nr:hypothetical protein [Paludibacteraceae bacterium]
MMTKRMFLYIIALTIVLLFAACNRQRNEADRMRLNKLDSLLSIQPEAAADSLKQFYPARLSHYNRGYYQLLEVIALDKTYYNFTSDSLISSTVHILSRHKQTYPHTYARSLMYQGLVRYRMGVTDSTAYEPIKEAADLLETKKINDPLLLYFCYHYIGLIHYENNNPSYSIMYYEKAIKKIKQYGDKNYLFNTYFEITWAYLKVRKFNVAKQYIDILCNFKNISDTQKACINQILSVYYEFTNQASKALEINKQLLRSNYSYTDMSSMLFKISNNYKTLNKLDSALLYAKKAEECKPDSDYYLNNLYYKNIGEISEQLMLWHISANAYKTAYTLQEKATSKALDKQIMTLEKKYDLKEAENKALQLTNRLIFTVFVSLILLILLVTSTVIFRQRGKHAEIKTRLLAHEKINVERNLIEKEFMLPLYQQISQRNANIKTFLSDLLTNPHLTKNPQLLQKIDETYQDFIKTSHINEFLTDEKFTEFTGMECESYQFLTENEKMLLVFAAMKLDNRQIAVLFNTTESSVRGRKAKLRVKLESNNIDIKSIII